MHAPFPVKHTVCLPLIVTLVASAPMNIHTLCWQFYTSTVSLFSQHTYPACCGLISLYQTIFCLNILLNQSVYLFWSCWAKVNSSNTIRTRYRREILVLYIYSIFVYGNKFLTLGEYIEKERRKLLLSQLFKNYYKHVKCHKWAPFYKTERQTASIL